MAAGTSRASNAANDVATGNQQALILTLYGLAATISAGLTLASIATVERPIAFEKAIDEQGVAL
jgi:hypothetical protein